MRAKILTLFLLLTGALLPAAIAQSTSKVTFAQPQLVHEFKIAVPQQRLDDIMAKVKAAKLPRQMPPAEGSASNWQSGMDMAWLAELQQYWVNSYNWREQEKILNSYPQYIANVDGYDIQFYYIKGEGKNPLPLLLTHGWPGSTFEFFDAIAPLTTPSKFGGKAEDAFTLIIPALPGFGFSSMPKVPVQGPTTARLWHKLVTEIIGHKQFVAQGGDWGAGATVQLAHLHPESVKAIHLNLFVWFPVPADQQTSAEKEYFAQSEAYMTEGFDYWRLQAHKPMMPAVALYDSPLGTAGWIAEKFWTWTDNNGRLENVISKDKLLTDIMLYLVNDGGIDGSFWYYRAVFTEMKGVMYPGYIKTPTAIAKYPKDFVMTHPPLELAKRGFNVVRFEDMPKGGHFAAMEQPLLFAKDVREAFHAYH